MQDLNIPVHLIWGEQDPWEPLPEAKRWLELFDCVQSLDVIAQAGHCPHDEQPDIVNRLLCTTIAERVSCQQAT